LHEFHNILVCYHPIVLVLCPSSHQILATPLRNADAERRHYAERTVTQPLITQCKSPKFSNKSTTL